MYIKWFNKKVLFVCLFFVCMLAVFAEVWAVCSWIQFKDHLLFKPGWIIHGSFCHNKFVTVNKVPQDSVALLCDTLTHGLPRENVSICYSVTPSGNRCGVFFFEITGIYSIGNGTNLHQLVFKTWEVSFQFAFVRKYFLPGVMGREFLGQPS